MKTKKIKRLRAAVIALIAGDTVAYGYSMCKVLQYILQHDITGDVVSMAAVILNGMAIMLLSSLWDAISEELDERRTKYMLRKIKSERKCRTA